MNYKDPMIKEATAQLGNMHRYRNSALDALKTNPPESLNEFVFATFFEQTRAALRQALVQQSLTTALCCLVALTDEEKQILYNDYQKIEHNLSILDVIYTLADERELFAIENKKDREDQNQLFHDLILACIESADNQIRLLCGLIQTLGGTVPEHPEAEPESIATAEPPSYRKH